MATRPSSAIVTLPSDTDILITRSFEAPRSLVWTTLTTPRHLLRWWGPDWCPLVSCNIDFRVGGSWRYLSRMADGTELGWHGTYLDIVAGERVESTEVFEGFPDAESRNTMTLTEADGVTTLQTLVRHSSKEHRDGHVQSGMEGGMQITFNRLDDLLGGLQRPLLEGADTAAERFRRVAGRFTEVAAAVTPEQWDRPAPCAGWVARDVVDHLVTWVPHVIGQAGIDFSGGPSAAEDPLGAWTHLAATLQAALDDPTVAAVTFDVGPPGTMSVEQAVSMIVFGDIFIHAWDLSAAAGAPITLDAGLVHDMFTGMQQMEAMLRASGHYGPAFEVPDTADEHDRFLAFLGRDPSFV
jgi:uncharacterized protein (TIGR03086 family)